MIKSYLTKNKTVTGKSEVDCQILRGYKFSCHTITSWTCSHPVLRDVDENEKVTSEKISNAEIAAVVNHTCRIVDNETDGFICLTGWQTILKQDCFNEIYSPILK